LCFRSDRFATSRVLDRLEIEEAQIFAFFQMLVGLLPMYTGGQFAMMCARWSKPRVLGPQGWPSGPRLFASGWFWYESRSMKKFFTSARLPTSTIAIRVAHSYSWRITGGEGTPARVLLAPRFTLLLGSRAINIGANHLGFEFA
jgi:hypothetical protein